MEDRDQMIWMIGAMVGLLAGVAGVKFLLQPPSELRLTVFRPWRGDPWPRGVQEDDDVRFDWSAEKRRRAQIRLGWEEIVVTPTTADTSVDPDPIEIAVEDVPGEGVIVEPIDSFSVRHRPH